MVALNSQDGPRQISEVLDESLLSDAPAAQIIREMLDMALNGEWYSGQDLLTHLPDELAKNPEVMKLLIKSNALSPEACQQILQECPRELAKEKRKNQRQELLFQLRECKDPMRQMEILNALKDLRD